jgi:hypothetical protein
MNKYAYRKHPAYAAFNAYMDGQFSELSPKDLGRNDPRKLCFLDMGVPEELIFFLWLAARREALEEAATAIKAEDDRMADEDYMLDSDDCIRVIRALSKDQTT